MSRAPWSRREVLRGAACTALAGLLPARAQALGDATRLDIAQISLTSGTLLRPRAWERLLYEVAQTTSVETLGRAPALAPEDLALFDHPLAVLVGDGTLPVLSEEAVASLSRYLQYGGFLFVDDASGLEHSAFDASVRALCARLFPTRPLAPLPRDHSLYRAFFLIHHPVGRLARAGWLEGVCVGEVTPLIYCRDDLSGALERGEDGRERYAVQPGGETQRREAIKLGINLVLYALTSNYKQDITHVRRLMEEGRL